MAWPLREKPADVFPQLKLETMRLVLRPARLSDYPQWKSVRSHNYDYLKPFEPSWPPDCLSRDFFERRVKRLADDWANDRTYAFLIFLENESSLIGGLNINNVARGAANFGTLGYWLDEAAQGEGYMTEAGFAVLSHAFTKMHFSRMNAATLPYNQKSRRMLERLGFVEEGFARNYIQINDRRQDHILFGLNAEDFSSAARGTR
jgi:ribosomal-protein-alanine N-acetyltransferase